MQLTHVRLLVGDFPGCFRFYRDVLGLEPGFGDEAGSYASFPVGDAQIALFRRDLMAEAVGTNLKPADAEAQDRVAVIIAVLDVDAAYDSIRSRGGSFINPPHDRPDWYVRCAHLRDPDGNLIEINRDFTPTNQQED